MLQVRQVGALAHLGHAGVALERDGLDLLDGRGQVRLLRALARRVLVHRRQQQAVALQARDGRLEVRVPAEPARALVVAHLVEELAEQDIALALLAHEEGSVGEVGRIVDVRRLRLADPLAENVGNPLYPRPLLLLPIFKLRQQEVLVGLLDRVDLAEDLPREQVEPLRRQDRLARVLQAVAVQHAQHVELVHVRVLGRDDLVQIVLPLDVLARHLLEVLLLQLVEGGPVLDLARGRERVRLQVDLLQRAHAVMRVAAARRRARMQPRRVAAGARQLEDDAGHRRTADLDPLLVLDQCAHGHHLVDQPGAERLRVSCVHGGHFVREQRHDGVDDGADLEVALALRHLHDPGQNGALRPGFGAALELVRRQLGGDELSPLASRNRRKVDAANALGRRERGTLRSETVLVHDARSQAVEASSPALLGIGDGPAGRDDVGRIAVASDGVGLVHDGAAGRERLLVLVGRLRVDWPAELVPLLMSRRYALGAARRGRQRPTAHAHGHGGRGSRRAPGRSLRRIADLGVHEGELVAVFEAHPARWRGRLGETARAARVGPRSEGGERMDGIVAHRVVAGRHCQNLARALRTLQRDARGRVPMRIFIAWGRAQGAQLVPVAEGVRAGQAAVGVHVDEHVALAAGPAFPRWVREALLGRVVAVERSTRPNATGSIGSLLLLRLLHRSQPRRGLGVAFIAVGLVGDIDAAPGCVHAIRMGMMGFRGERGSRREERRRLGKVVRRTLIVHGSRVVPGATRRVSSHHGSFDIGQDVVKAGGTSILRKIGRHGSSRAGRWTGQRARLWMPIERVGPLRGLLRLASAVTRRLLRRLMLRR